MSFDTFDQSDKETSCNVHFDNIDNFFMIFCETFRVSKMNFLTALEAIRGCEIKLILEITCVARIFCKKERSK